mmetsp:Transcript_19705/g.33779  ORF Transcript_19705/g.33779 Transcript_19705/m.33779 type:complete len:306 (+) Transcript_19705:131-1048(+)|eukprot:CAMPEP_0184701430 /NCGR_PEP_ID=MMETSP0313-20130426/19866_1 /TAXON_ID=2792 /ORGANISM="Porphyridium aerugineum, Strain SAG 1380-2" /LENGTH=305 /DNA_ID=CAMNT_0027161491 /DNA_START=163 /DNA_END=1080 /DNA_ORIENTATION=+
MESVALLPSGTVVVIKGNNRTKKSVSGAMGVVLSSVALGGWHSVECSDEYEGTKRKVIRVQRNALEVVTPPSPSASSSRLEGGSLPSPLSNDNLEARFTNVSKLLGNLRYGTLRKYRKHFGLRIAKEHTKTQLAHVVRIHFTGWDNGDEKKAIQSFISKVQTKPIGAGYGGPDPKTSRPVWQDYFKQYLEQKEQEISTNDKMDQVLAMANHLPEKQCAENMPKDSNVGAIDLEPWEKTETSCLSTESSFMTCERGRAQEQKNKAEFPSSPVSSLVSSPGTVSSPLNSLASMPPEWSPLVLMKLSK